MNNSEPEWPPESRDDLSMSRPRPTGVHPDADTLAGLVRYTLDPSQPKGAIHPDVGRLLGWLLGGLKQVEAENEALRARLDRVRDCVEGWDEEEEEEDEGDTP